MPTLASVKERAVDWLALGAAVLLSLLGLLTMNSFVSGDPFFVRQAIWLGLSIAVYFGAARVDWRFLRRSGVAASLYLALIVPLMLLLVLGTAVKGAKSWLSFGSLGIQPIELAKLALIVALAKYFSRRHIEIRNLRHIIVSGAYAGLVFVLVALQPDLGGAIIVGLIWLGLVLVSGISRKHLAIVFGGALLAFSALWFFGLHDYQKQRLMTFVHPLADIRGAGYNAYQSTVAVGSGELLGKGIGYGTQSKLRFLPEYQTDFIFAAFAEEWGFFGIVIVFSLFGVIFWRVLRSASKGASNFETLFALGILCYFGAHFVLHVGINMGLLPVTGTTIPFMSYGGSHLIIEFLALGMLAGMNRYSRATHRDMLDREFSGGYDR
ncbi:MAG: mrdB [Candidatus Adlerbacteria bacterium]|nr:mrdB [Candidatus Adlerbacteria bacterium]